MHRAVQPFPPPARPFAVAVALLALAGSAGAQDGAEGPAADVVEAVAGAGGFGRLVAAIEASGLAAELTGEGPWTLFAPTDEAFDALPDGYVDGLLEPAVHDELVELLSYHVVRGRFATADLAGMVDDDGMASATIETLDGHTLVVEDQAGLRIDGAEILGADIEAGNGIVHAIDTVLLPDAS